MCRWAGLEQRTGDEATTTMALNKQQELILKNVDSIMAAVRERSLQQMMNLPITPEQKQQILTKALSDSEESVRKTAQGLLAKLGASVPTPAAPPVASVPDPTPGEPPGEAASETPPEATVETAPPAPAAVPTPPTSASAAPGAVTPTPAATPRTGTGTPAGNAPTAGPRAATVMASGDLGLVRATAEDLAHAFGDDPSLPDLAKLPQIPQRLDQINLMKTKKPAGFIKRLLQLAGDVHEEVALTALEAMSQLRSPAVPEHVLPMLSQPGLSSQRRFLAMKILAEVPVELDLAQIEQLLAAEKDVIIKSRLIKVYARLARQNGGDFYRLCLSDTDPRVRANTIEVMEELNLRECEPDVVPLLADPENRVKVNAAKYLVKSGNKQAFMTLRTMLGSQDVWLRDCVIFALGEIGDQSSLTLLKGALKDPNQGIRLSVLKALTKINNSIARETLQNSCNDGDPVVAQVARGLWEKIKDTPPRPLAAPPAAPRPAAPAAGAPVPTAALPIPPRPAAPVPAPTPSAAPARAVAPAVPSGNEIALPDMSDLGDTPAPTAPAAAPTRPATPPAPPPKPVPPTAAPVAPKPVAAPPRPVPPTAAPATPRPVAPPPVKPAAPATPATAAPAAPAAPATPTTPTAAPKPIAPLKLPPGAPPLTKPRSAEIYLRLLAPDAETRFKAIGDLGFVTGDDAVHLLNVAIVDSEPNNRLQVAKILSRLRVPNRTDLMKQLAADENPLVNGFAAKALSMLK